MPRLDRRTFLAAAASALVVPLPARAQTAPSLLRVERRSIEVNGRSARMFGLLDAAGKPGLSFTAGDRFAVKLDNRADEPTLVHWHGLTPPWRQDGVPDVTQPPLLPGQSYDYDFPLSRGGTHWMHAHTLQEQQLLAAPLIVRDKSSADEQEVVILLHDFAFKTPQEILAGLKGTATTGQTPAGSGSGSGTSSGSGSGAAGSGSGSGSGASGSGSGSTAGGDHAGHAHARDIDYDAFLANDRTLADPQVVRVETGARVRLRLINAASATGFLIDLGALEGTLIAVDGQPVAPLKLRRVPLAMAQRADIRVTLPKGNGAFPILALQEDGTGRTGIVLATKTAKIAKLPVISKAKLGLLDATLEKSLRAVSPLAAQSADRIVDVELTGTHAGYTWGLAVKNKGEAAQLVHVKAGERVEVRMHNPTSMPHPMHLHGHHFQVTSIDGRAIAGAMRDTVNLPPRSRVTIAFDADNPGKWMFHCHHLYHMETGMMTQVVYEGVG